MILLVDNSNTRTKFMLADSDALQLHTLRVIPTTEVSVKRVLSLVQDWRFSKAIIASVVPWAADVLETALATLCDVTFLTSGYLSDLIKVDYPGMETLGADRVANILAVVEHYPLPCVAIDAGTAITYDLVVSEQQNACYVGGAIAPGLATMAYALNQGTAVLPEVCVSSPVPALGKSTKEAIAAGVYWGAVGMLEKTICQLQSHINQNVNVVLTGGDASSLTQALPRNWCCDAWLTFRGLLAAARLFN